MSTLGTFSEYADFNFFQDAAKGLGKIVKKANKTGASANKKVKKVVNSARRAVEPGYKAKEDLAKGVLNRNIMIGAGLGTAGLGTAGAIALNNRKKNANMSAKNETANFISQETKDAVKKVRDQQGVEKLVDAGKDTGKAGLIARGTAIAGSPERDLIRSGKASDKKWVKGLAEGAEKAGKAGYKAGATGA
jgi:hypothetical protein